jgi:endonuclease YncB( thermonuclease family)
VNRTRVGVRVIFAGTAVFVATVFAAPSTTTGIPSVIDGDTLEIRGQRFRLHGVDAPESSQICLDSRGAKYRCGALAANKLSERIARRNVTCLEKDRDRYKRIVAVCKLGKEDLNAWLVSSGFAVAYRQYSRDYVKQESAARASSRGLWAGQFQMPWDYRKSPGALPSAGATQAPPKPSSASEPYYRNCAAARAAGAAPIMRGEPGYRGPLDRDKDGIACE